MKNSKKDEMCSLGDALERFNLKDTASWAVMSSKCIFYTMNFYTKVKDPKADLIDITIHRYQVVHIDINWCISRTIAS